MCRRPSLSLRRRAGVLLLLLLGCAASPLPAQSVRERIAALGEQIPALRLAIERAQATERPPLTRAPPVPPAFLNDSIRRQVQAIAETYRAVDLREGITIAERMLAATARIDEALARFAETGDRQTLSRIKQPELDPLTLLARDWRLLRACCALDLAAPPPSSTPPPPTMPDVVGQDLRRARATLSRAGLRLAGIDTMESEVGPGTVIGQAPPAGAAIERGSSARVTIAAAKLVPVPDLSRLSLDEATAEVGREGLVIGEARSVISDAAAGTVVDQAPEAGRRVPPGTRITVTLAAERPVVVPLPVESALVPNVVTLTLADARDTLVARGLYASVLPQQQDSASWLVAGQNPPPDVAVPAGTAVRVQLQPPAQPEPVVAGGDAGSELEGSPGGLDLPEPPFVEPAGGGSAWLPLLGGAILLLLGGLGGWWWRAARSGSQPAPSPAHQQISPPPAVVVTTLRIPPGHPEVTVTDGRPLRRHEVLVGLRQEAGRTWVAAGVPCSSKEE